MAVPGLDPGTHVFHRVKAWIPATSAGMTEQTTYYPIAASWIPSPPLRFGQE
jgi:hypothetical protein